MNNKDTSSWAEEQMLVLNKYLLLLQYYHNLLP